MAGTVRVGQIVGAFGLSGQVKIEPLIGYGDPFAAGSQVCLRGDWVRVEYSSIHKGRPLVKLEGVNDMTAAERLQWEYLDAAMDDVELEQDEYLTSNLIGMSVVTVEGEALGAVKAVHHYPAHDVIEVGGTMIPAVKQFVKSVDLEARTMTVELIEGMRG